MGGSNCEIHFAAFCRLIFPSDKRGAHPRKIATTIKIEAVFDCTAFRIGGLGGGEWGALAEKATKAAEFLPILNRQNYNP